MRQTIVVDRGPGAGEVLVDCRWADGRSSWQPGEEAVAHVHVGPGGIVAWVRASSGIVADGGEVTLTDTQQMTWPAISAVQSLPVAAEQVSMTWYGNVAQVMRSGADIVATGGQVPAIADVAYTWRARAYRVIPPADAVSGWPILLVVRVEEV